MSFLESLSEAMDDYMAETRKYGVSYNSNLLHDLSTPLPDYSRLTSNLTIDDLNNKTDDEIIKMFPYFDNLFNKMDEYKNDPMALFSFTNSTWKQTETYRTLTNILIDYVRTYIVNNPHVTVSFIECTSAALIAAFKNDKKITFRKVKNQYDINPTDLLVSGFHDNRFNEVISRCKKYITIDITQELYDSGKPSYELHGRHWKLRADDGTAYKHKQPLQGARIEKKLTGVFSELNLISYVPSSDKVIYVEPASLSVSLTDYKEGTSNLVGFNGDQITFPHAIRHPVSPWDPHKPYDHSEYIYKEKIDGKLFASPIYSGYFICKDKVMKLSQPLSGHIQYEVKDGIWYYSCATLFLHGWDWEKYYLFFKKYLHNISFPPYKLDISQVKYQEGIIMIRKMDTPYHTYHYYLKEKYTVDLDSESYNALFSRDENFDGIREYDLYGNFIKERRDKKKPNSETEVKRTYIANLLNIKSVIQTKKMPGPELLVQSDYESWEDVLEGVVDSLREMRVQKQVAGISKRPRI